MCGFDPLHRHHGSDREDGLLLPTPRPERIAIQLTSPLGKRSEGEIECLTWTEPEIRSKAFRTSGIVLLVGLLMIPIPLIHFLAIPVVLLGAPIVFVVICKLYSGTSGTKGSGPCPSCGAAVDLTKQIDGWPIREICPACRESCVVDKCEK